MSQLPLWVEYAQALGTPAIAIAGVAIAGGQFWLAGMRLRHDLYDRSQKVFEAVKRLFAVIFSDAKVPRDEYYKYVQGTSEAVFVLNDKTVEYLEEIRRQAAQMIFIETRLGNPDLQQATRAQLADQEAEIMNWFVQQPDVLVAKFKPFMQLRTWRWP
jgi:hypothetical protein